VFLNMIRMFYDNHSFEVFMSACPIPGMEAAVNNLVAGNTKLGWGLRMQVWAFYAICALQRHLPIVARLKLSDQTLPSEGAIVSENAGAVS
jgi:hypothetical protein